MATYSPKHIPDSAVVDLRLTLARTGVASSTRSHVIDWTVEVLTKLERFSARALFRAVFLLDTYLKHSPAYLTDEDVHCIGVTVIFVASKYEDVRPLRLSTLLNKATYNKFSSRQIVESEARVVAALQFKLSAKTTVEAFDHYLVRAFGQSHLLVAETVQRTGHEFLLAIACDVFFNNFDPRVVALGTLYQSSRFWMLRSAGSGQRECFAHFHNVAFSFIGEVVALLGSRAKELKAFFKYSLSFLKSFRTQFEFCGNVYVRRAWLRMTVLTTS